MNKRQIKTNATPLTKQFSGEATPRRLYIHTRSGGSDKLMGYAFSAKDAHDAAFGAAHAIISESADSVVSTAGGQTFTTKLAQ